MHYWEVLGAGITATVLSFLLTWIVKRVAVPFGAVRVPGGRHLHANVTPLWGGVAIILTIIAVIVFHPTLVISQQIFHLCLGLALLLVLGVLDDRYDISWPFLLCVQSIAASIFVLGGVTLSSIPIFDSFTLHLDAWRIAIPFCTGTCSVALLGSLFVIIWLLLCMNAFNWLDGADGIATSVSILGCTTIVFLALTASVEQPPVAILSAIGAGASAGFLFWNRPRARIFMGSAGSFGLGFFLGAMAVIAGAKLATMAMVLLLPLADALAVLCARVMQKSSPTRSDLRHLHHDLVLRGWSPWHILALYAGTSALLGIGALLLPRPWKLITLAVLFFTGTAWLVILKRVHISQKVSA